MDEELTECMHCNELEPEDEMTEVTDYGSVCHDCIDCGDFNKCYNCEELFNESDLVDNHLIEQKFCSECADSCEVQSDNRKAYKQGIYHPDA